MSDWRRLSRPAANPTGLIGPGRCRPEALSLAEPLGEEPDGLLSDGRVRRRLSPPDRVDEGESLFSGLRCSSTADGGSNVMAGVIGVGRMQGRGECLRVDGLVGGGVNMKEEYISGTVHAN